MSRRTSSTGDYGSEVWHSGNETVVGSSSSLYGSLGDRTIEGSQRSELVTEDENDTLTERPRHTNIFIYCSHFLSAWGDRMWSFGVGLFLVRIAGNTLQLPAIYGLTSGLSIFVLGALVGDWIDSTPRLKAARISLVTQNLLVATCAGGVFAYIHWEDWLQGHPGGWAVPLGQAVIILLAVLADLSSMARVLAVEKDWIVKICGQDRDMLARMTATLRRIDQTTLIVAPVATGQVMTYAGQQIGALFIGVWNLLSVFLEYYLMWKVYSTVPALASKETGIGNEEETPLLKDKNTKRLTSTITLDESETTLTNSNQQPQTPPITPTASPSHPTIPDHPARKEAAAAAAAADDIVVKTTPQWNEFSKSYRTDLVGTIVADTEILLEESEDFLETNGSGRDGSTGLRGCCGRAMRRFSALYEGWRQYKKYTVALAGLALSFLYMTVLGFDNITVAYAVTQGVSESILGIMMAVSAVFGMVGTFIYPIWRRRVGLVRTGMLALSCQVLCLSLCVLSIWMPGSPFDPTYSKVPSAEPAAAAAAAAMSSDGSTWKSSAQTTSWTTSKGSYPSLTTQTGTTSHLPTYTSIMASLETSQPRWTPSKTSSATLAPSFLETKNTNPTSSSKMLNSSSNIQASFTTTRMSTTENNNVSLNSKNALNMSEIISARTVEASLNTETSTIIAETFPTSQIEGGTTTKAADTSSSADAVTSLPSDSSSSQHSSYVSVSLFIAGIVLARFGLWTADLAITQQFLEAVKEGERGAVNGVQGSLNQFFDVLKFFLVILIPDTQTFGFLILLSFAFICASWVLYAVFLKRVRGHFCPRWKCCNGTAEYAGL